MCEANTATAVGESPPKHRDALTPPSAGDAEAYCRTLARRHYENFPVVTWLLPRRLHQDFFNVYAFCRWADDLADETFDRQLSLRLLDWFEGELRACFEGRDIAHPVFVALRQTLARHPLTVQPFADLLSAFRQDQTVREYETRSQLLDYCRRSANPVGRIVLALCGEDTCENVADSDAVCTGLQLANFWQDVARDWRRGRIYLPREDRRRHPGSDEAFRSTRTNEAFAALLAEEVAWTRGFLERVFPLAARLPRRLRIDIELFGRGGLAILQKIESIGYRVWEHRPTLGKRDVAGLLLRTLWRWGRPRPGRPAKL
ncbi:MAG: squalene synthase HpnC [Planctomycetota bacterium]|nr:MAG: squalene synthase HpnC [Planctomycetota bacterium]